jgi:hypothetical protein
MTFYKDIYGIEEEPKDHEGNVYIACDSCGTEYHLGTEYHTCGLCECDHNDEDHTTLDNGFSECKHCDCDLYQGHIGTIGKKYVDKREAAYDNITGEWHPEEWAKHSESDDTMSFWHYPPYHEHSPDSSNVDITEPNSSISIGKGHLFSGYIEHYHPTETSPNGRGISRPGGLSPMYSINGRSRNLKEAEAEAQKYRDLHNATYNGIDSDQVQLYISSIKDKHGNSIGSSWVQDHYIPHELFYNVDELKSHIEKAHKFLYDRNNDTRGGQKPMFSSKKWYDR